MKTERMAFIFNEITVISYPHTFDCPYTCALVDYRITVTLIS